MAAHYLTSHIVHLATIYSSVCVTLKGPYGHIFVKCQRDPEWNNKWSLMTFAFINECVRDTVVKEYNQLVHVMDRMGATEMVALYMGGDDMELTLWDPEENHTFGTWRFTKDTLREFPMFRLHGDITRHARAHGMLATTGVVLKESVSVPAESKDAAMALMWEFIANAAVHGTHIDSKLPFDAYSAVVADIKHLPRSAAMRELASQYDFMDSESAVDNGSGFVPSAIWSDLACRPVLGRWPRNHRRSVRLLHRRNWSPMMGSVIVTSPDGTSVPATEFVV